MKHNSVAQKNRLVIPMTSRPWIAVFLPPRPSTRVSPKLPGGKPTTRGP